MKELEEYYWNEVTENGEVVYLMLDGEYLTDTIPQPISKHVAPNFTTEEAFTKARDLYWGQLIVHLKTQA